MLNAGDLKRAGSFLTRDACFVTPDRTSIHGRAEIREALAQLASSTVGIEVLASLVLRAGEVAVVSERWGLTSADPQGEAYVQETNSTIVLRRLEEGWKLAIVAPWR
jgi:ketosteroid isomerase-like protein